MVLLCRAGHFVLPPQCQNLHKADVKEQPFHNAGKHNQRFQQLLVSFLGASFKFGIGQRVNKRNQKLVFVADRLNLVIGVKHFAFVQPEAFDDVLIGVSVNRFFKGLAQQELAAFWRGDLAIGAQHNVIGGQAVSGDKKT